MLHVPAHTRALRATAGPCNITAFRCLHAVSLVSARGSASPRAVRRRFGQRRRRAANHGGVLPLRPHATLLHKAAFAKLSAVATLKLRLVPPAAPRPRGFANRPYAKWPSLGSGRVSRCRSPVAARPRATGCAPWCWFCVGMFGQALRARCLACGLRPVIRVVLPRPPAGASPLRGIGPRAGSPSAPQGAPSAGARIIHTHSKNVEACAARLL